MNTKTLVIVIVVVAILGIGGYWYVQNNQQVPTPATVETQQTASAPNFGAYDYECDEHVAFTATVDSDMSSIHVKAAGGGAYPPEANLTKIETASGARYEGAGVILTAKGETITLGEGESAINCSPVPSADAAPFNFGD